MIGIGTLTPNISLPTTQRHLSSQQSGRFRMSVSSAAVVSERSLYEVLRVRQNASQVEIKTAYRTLAKLYHPDASPADGRDFIEIRNAYATLSDPGARAVYDLHLSASDSKRRRWGSAGVRTPARDRFYPTHRWESDQCW